MSDPRPPSYGNMSDQHWSKTRAETNRDALDYLRERSKAPGVAEGGGSRNFYCMECAGVIPAEGDPKVCPHCGAPIEGGARRYFNWVEMNEPPRSDLRALLPWIAAGFAGLVLFALLLTWWLTD